MKNRNLKGIKALLYTYIYDEVLFLYLENIEKNVIWLKLVLIRFNKNKNNIENS
jgi:hypothetical protein